MNKKSYVLHQWGYKQAIDKDRLKFHTFPFHMFTTNIKQLFNSWKENGEMIKFKMEVIYAEV